MENWASRFVHFEVWDPVAHLWTSSRGRRISISLEDINISKYQFSWRGNGWKRRRSSQWSGTKGATHHHLGKQRLGLLLLGHCHRDQIFNTLATFTWGMPQKSNPYQIPVRIIKLYANRFKDTVNSVLLKIYAMDRNGFHFGDIAFMKVGVIALNWKLKILLERYEQYFS